VVQEGGHAEDLLLGCFEGKKGRDWEVVEGGGGGRREGGGDLGTGRESSFEVGKETKSTSLLVEL